MQVSGMTALDPGEAMALLRRAAGARGVRFDGAPHSVGGIRLPMTGPGRDEELVWGTVGGQDGLLALFGRGRLLAAVPKGLGEIRRVSPLALPGLPQFAAVVDDRVDQMTGAFFRTDRRLIYVWDGRTLRQVYEAPLEAEQFSHARWENPQGPDVWRLERTLGEVTVRDGIISEVMRVQHLEAPGRPDAPLPPLASFRLVHEQRSERRLVWNARLRRFE